MQGRLLPFALALAIAGCAGPGKDVPSAPSPVADAQTTPSPPAVAWWREAGDPVLATLVQQGLDRNPDVVCQVAALRRFDHETEKDARRVGARLGRLFGGKDARPDPKARLDRVERVSSHRERIARQIARAYVDVRRLQQDVALRGALRDQYKDNAEVAQFRREAGLVSGIDASLARSQNETVLGELGFAQGRLATAMAELARLAGDRLDALATRLGAPGSIPELPVDPLSMPALDDPDRAALADAILREARLVQTLAESRRTVKDARTAYREGAGSFATLYVSEAAAIAVDLALVDARASRVTATLDLWSGRNGQWARAGLEPVVGPDPASLGQTITVNAPCD